MGRFHLTYKGLAAQFHIPLTKMLLTANIKLSDQTIFLDPKINQYLEYICDLVVA